MNYYFAARAIYSKNSIESLRSWEKYIKWSRLTQLTELISVDSMLNEDLVNPDRNSKNDWNYIVKDGPHKTGLYTSLQYVLEKVANLKLFNLLTVVVEPDQKCENIPKDDFMFAGYDLLDKDYIASALSNCGGFDESFLPGELNRFGLIDDYSRAYEIKSKLLENNPDEDHADTNVIAIWRHLKMGQPLNKI